MAVWSESRKHEYWVRQWEHRKRFYQQENDLHGRLIAFAQDLEHYRRNYALSNSIQRIQPKGLQQYNLLRHKTAGLVGPPLSFDARPVQPMADADAAIVTRRVIEQVIEDPKKKFKPKLYRMALTGFTARRGVIAVEWDWNVNGVTFRNADSRYVFQTPGFLDLNDERTPDVIEQVPMRLSQVRRMGWKVPRDLTADNHKPDFPTGGVNESHRVDLENGSNAAYDVGEGTEDDGIVTILKCYSRRDPFEQTRVAKVPTDLPQEQWYWTNDQGERIPVIEQPNPPEPGWRLVTQNEDERNLSLYPGGYLCIIAAFDDKKRVLFEGTWLPDAVNTDVRLRSFPFMEFCPYLHSLRRAGLSDTELTHSLQLIDNMSFRSAWEQLRQANLFITAPMGGLFDAQKRAFQITDDPIQIAYYQDRMAAEGIGFHQAPGMNSALPAFRSMMDGQWAFIGTGDIAMPSQRSRDVAVGTIEAMQKMGDLPLQMHKDLFDNELAILLGVVLDYERAYRADQQIVQWVTDQGELANANITGADLVGANVLITADPNGRLINAERMQAVAQFAGQLKEMPELMVDLAPWAGLPPEAVRKLQMRVSQMLEQRGQKQPPDPDKLITALANLLRVAPNDVTIQQVQQALSMAGLQAGQPQLQPHRPNAVPQPQVPQGAGDMAAA